MKISKAIADSIDDDKDELKMKELMMSNAYLIPAKISGAEAIELANLKHENAVIVRISARELLAQTSMLKELKLVDKNYLKLLRDEIEEFRVMYLEWIKTFDQFEDIDDGWH
jgi:hypothetical protein